MKICLVAHNIRSSHNVGSIFRTAEGIGVEQIYLSGYTPYPIQKNDSRLPHIAQKVNYQIVKTSLGSEQSQKWLKVDDIFKLIDSLKQQDWAIIGLEQSKKSIKLPNFVPTKKTVVILGNEVTGIDTELLAKCDQIVEIPMNGSKESFNVVQAGAMMLYHVRYFEQIRL